MTETNNKKSYLRVRNHIIMAPNSYYVNIIKNEHTITLNNEKYHFLSKDYEVIIEVIKKPMDEPINFIELSQQEINDMIKIMSPLYYNSDSLKKTDEHVFSIEPDALSKELFNAIKKTNSYQQRLYKLVCLVSRTHKAKLIFNSLVMSTTALFSGKVRNLIENDISKKWTLSSVAKEFNLSEIAVRKKLSRENTSFYRILLDVRMEKAAMLILKNEFHIRRVSDMVGISSPSYFIKTFQLYHGLTPKKFLMQNK
ncbi:TPA: helix-turn-helix transcriptional regulator [Escherichia coli]|nr:helix-turn-helix transcriptional regulator [Escherichia coli]